MRAASDPSVPAEPTASPECPCGARPNEGERSVRTCLDQGLSVDVYIMERMQMYLGRGQRTRLGMLARARDRPVAELVREAVERYLAAEAPEIRNDDPLFGLVGADEGLERDDAVSERHHEVLARGAHWERSEGGDEPTKRSRPGRNRRPTRGSRSAG